MEKAPWDYRTFYLVWQPESLRPPTHRHASVQDARREATRLADLNPGKQFYVLVAVGEVRRTDPVSWTDLRAKDETPF